VLPVKEISQNAHCNKLKKMFEMTDVISWQLYQYALGGQLATPSETSKVDRKLPPLQLIKGRTYSYSSSILGRLEEYLDGMPLNAIR
jgi:hypothetical protein